MSHGHTKAYHKTSTYSCWAAMISRCENARGIGFDNYGGRGIAVCDRWRASFENFLSDMGERPLGLTIDRIDNDGGYEPGNCRWATYSEQQKTKRPRKGAWHSQETREKIAATLRGRKNGPRSPEVVAKARAALVASLAANPPGPRSEEAKAKTSASLKEAYASGRRTHRGGMAGKTHSEETRQKMSESHRMRKEISSG